MMQHLRCWCGSSYQDWMSCCQYQTSHRYQVSFNITMAHIISHLHNNWGLFLSVCSKEWLNCQYAMRKKPNDFVDPVTLSLVLLSTQVQMSACLFKTTLELPSLCNRSHSGSCYFNILLPTHYIVNVKGTAMWGCCQGPWEVCTTCCDPAFYFTIKINQM